MQSSKSKTHDPTTPNPTTGEKGMTLMLTLMTLAVLATIIVQFQVDAALYQRTASHRIEKEQCRYAAESGLVIATHFIKETLRKYKGRFPTNLSLSSDSSMGSPIPSDPNQPLDQDRSFQRTLAGSKIPPFVLMRDIIQIGQIDLEIEIHDENAKWPVLWHMIGNGPYAEKKYWAQTQVQNAYNKFAGLSRVNRDDAKTALKLIYDTGNHFRLPPAEFTVNTTYNIDRSTRRIITRNIGYTKKREETVQRRDQMKLFGRDFKYRLMNDVRVATLNENLPGSSASFADTLGIWGHNRININTAPPELLKSAFLPLGLSDQKVRMIIEYRKKRPFYNTNDLRRIKGFDSALLTRMRPLCVVGPETFTARITARIGRTQYRLLGSFYHYRGQLILMAVISEKPSEVIHE